MFVDDLIAINLGIDRRIGFQRLDRGLHEKRHKAEFDAVLFDKAILIAFAQIHDRGHVDLIEGRKHGRRILRLFQTLGDAFAQPGHFHPFFAASCKPSACRRGCRRRTGGHGIRFGHIALRPCALNGANINAFLSSDFPGGRTCICAGRGGCRNGRCRSRYRCWLSRRGFGSCRRCRWGITLFDQAKQCAYLDIIALRYRDLGQNARGWRIDLQGHFVSFKLNERLISGDAVARSLEPPGNGGFGHRFTECRYLDLDCHSLLRKPGAIYQSA